jgi:MGT family glycosyltransferase
MARFLVGSTALLGHIVPLAPIVTELVRRGHDVRWYTGAYYRDRVEAAGATYVPMRFARDESHLSVSDRFPERCKYTGIHSLLFDIRYLFTEQVAEKIQDLQAALDDFPADVVFSDAAFPAAAWLHELGGPRWAVLNQFAINFSGQDMPPFGLGSPPAASQFGRVRVKIQQALGSRYLYGRTTAYLDQLRAELGLPPTGEIFWDRMLSPYLYMQGSIRGLEYPRRDLPAQFHFIGPSLSQAEPPPFDPPEWWDELTSGRPAVLVTQGTISNNPEQLLLPAIRGLADEDSLTIATTGGGPMDQLTCQALPSNARVASFIPYDQLLPRINAMVTNGGYNGVQMALSHGVPLVVAGATEDKLEVNARIAWTGVGVDLATSSPEPELIRNVVRAVLDDPGFRERAQRMAVEFGEHDGPTAGASLLEELARTGKPVIARAPG